MKKAILIGLAAMMAASLLSPASAAPAPPKQTQEGTILFPAVFAAGLGADGCWAGLTRRITQTAAGQGSGLFGYRFAVDKATWGGKFALEAVGGQGTVDLDIFMYSVMPPAEEVANDPVNGGTPVSVDFQTREEGGETGIVPKGTTDAIVCLYGGVAGYAGVAADFEYNAFTPVKKKK
ncbi:MAG TPA: hypothetical protein VJ927_00140 [Actinomycetota bacterium]|nr:hypothetical protein [Actinomycetota bacterium]